MAQRPVQLKMENDQYCETRTEVPAEFAGIVTYFYSARNNSDRDVRKILAPSFQTILAFSFGGEITFQSRGTSLPLDQCLILGPIKQPIEYTLAAGADLLVVNFKDDAFYRFFGPALLSGLVATHPDQLLDQSCFTELWVSLKDLPTDQRTALILKFCRPYLKCREASFEGISQEAADYRVISPIKAVAQKTGQSERNIQLNHKKYLGYTAKERARYERFLKVLQLLQGISGKVDWLQVAETCGYYDQSQLIHDFKHFLNLSPGRYLKFQEEVCQVGL